MATVLTPGLPPYQLTPKNGRTFTLPELQWLVGGYIEALRTGDGRWLILNEDGKRLHLPVNLTATGLMHGRITLDDWIVGTCVVCSPLEAGENEDNEIDGV